MRVCNKLYLERVLLLESFPTHIEVLKTTKGWKSYDDLLVMQALGSCLNYLSSVLYFCTFLFVVIFYSKLFLSFLLDLGIILLCLPL